MAIKKTPITPARPPEPASPPKVAAATPAPPMAAPPKPAEPKSVDVRVAETRPVETRPVETRPVETKSVETKPVEPKPATPKPAIPKPADDMTSIMKSMPEPVRQSQEKIMKAAEDGMAIGRKQMEAMKQTASETHAAVDSAMSSAGNAMVAFNLKMLEAFRTNATANFELMTALMGAKSTAEAVELQSAHLRRQIESMTAQSREFAALAQKMATDAVEPVASAARRFTKPER